MSSADVMNLLEVIEPTVTITKTGAYKVKATVKAKEDLFIYGDVPAVADGIIEAHIFDGTREIGTAKMVLPINGVGNTAKIVGIGLEGAEYGKTYTVTFTDYKMWLMEK